MKKLANLRVCASCEWIFQLDDYQECPKCGFAHYGARMVYGNKAYSYYKSQKPWYDKKLMHYESSLRREIRAYQNEVLTTKLKLV